MGSLNSAMPDSATKGAKGSKGASSSDNSLFSFGESPPSAPAPLPAPSPDFGTTPDFGGGLSSYGSDTSLSGGSLFDDAPALHPEAPTLHPEPIEGAPAPLPAPTLADPLAPSSSAAPTLGADPTDRQTRAFNKRQEAANLKAARADSDAAWKFHQDKKAAEQKAASQRTQARRQAQAAERQQEAQARKTHQARMQAQKAQQAQQAQQVNPIKEQQRRNFEAHKAQARQVRWTQPNLRPSLANQPKGPKPVGSEEDYKRDFQRYPVTAQAEADRIVDTIPVEDWSSTQALMAQTSPGYFQSGHPANNKVRPKVDQWYKNTYPGKIDLSSGQSARGGGGMQADDRRQVDAHINAGSGTRAKAVAPYDPEILVPSAGDASRAPDLTKRLEAHGQDRDWTPGEIEDFKDQFDALDGRDQEAYLRFLEGDAGSNRGTVSMDEVSGGSGTNHLIGGSGEDTFGLYDGVETQVVGDGFGDSAGNRYDPPSSEGRSKLHNRPNDDNFDYDAGYANDQQAKENDRHYAPIINDSNDRKKAIVNNENAIFEITDNPQADNSAPWYANDDAGKTAIWAYGTLIDREAKKQGVDPDLVKAIVYSENARGNYFGAAKAAEGIGIADSILPMNIQPETWKELGISMENAFDPAKNIKAGVLLIRRIQERIEDPNPAKIASIWNYMGREKVNDFGAYVGRIHSEKPWAEGDQYRWNK
ncbi:transglycosylase SLT domain-containing protein [Magnetospira sp. QH-2]|uniref:transglycosylase SLT domain-containing protein n=1 Tax=Magnetospira sp. (strain QH-2) TaxID=1288970 RepID=UPI0003E81981|nr:transglycosylase SLT domain-containing protein [Magnetospira sp. QH-2]CCQ74812.1 protein of unknown function [Magnetospira sp. QH-2]